MMNQTATKFYVVECSNVGPNAPYDFDHIGIFRTPAINNGDGSPCIDGWAGTTDDISIRARGEFDTIEAAEAKIAELYPDRRVAELDDGYDDGDCIALYRPGRYATMTREMTCEWLYEAIRDLTGDETEEELQAILDIAEANANDGGETLHFSGLYILTAARNEKAIE